VLKRTVLCSVLCVLVFLASVLRHIMYANLVDPFRSALEAKSERVKTCLDEEYAGNSIFQLLHDATGGKALFLSDVDVSCLHNVPPAVAKGIIKDLAAAPGST
jgi:hypothetical protein